MIAYVDTLSIFTRAQCIWKLTVALKTDICWNATHANLFSMQPQVHSQLLLTYNAGHIQCDVKCPLCGCVGPQQLMF